MLSRYRSPLQSRQRRLHESRSCRFQPWLEIMQVKSFSFFRIGTEPSRTFVLNPRSLSSGGSNIGRLAMGQQKPLRATALIVEDDPMQRQMICRLLEESDYDVIQCESAEAAQFVLERNGGSLWLMITDVKLAGQMDGVELAHIAKEHVPDLEVIVTSGKPLRQALPEGAKFWSKPWVPLDVIREAERMSVSHRT